MKIHAIQTGTVAIRPNQRQAKGTGYDRLFNTLTDHRWTEPLPIYAWVIEHPEGVIVVDTGETARTSEQGYFTTWHPYFKNVRSLVTPDQEIGPQLQALGIHPNDVRWVVMTHLHTDHAGGLAHFPKSEIVINRRAYQLATGFAGQARGFLPQHFPAWLNPTLIDLAPRPWGTFPASLSLTQAEDVLIVPTSGHTEAHQSVVLRTNDTTYFFAGDTSYSQQLMLDQQIDGVSLDAQSSRRTVQRIRQLAEQMPLVYLPSHDPEAAERLENKIAAIVRNRAESTKEAMTI
jgi:N-acyl homoserine lactone hydrolase